LTSRLQPEGARDRIRVATYHSDLQVFVSRSSVVLNITHVLSSDRMYVASEDVTSALHAATRRLRLKCRSTALESPVTYLHLESVTFALGCSHQTMHSETNAQQSQAPVFMCYLPQNRVNLKEFRMICRNHPPDITFSSCSFLC
jgi:hypothetical protein